MDMFRLFKDVQKRGGHERVTREKDWEEVAAGLGFSSMGEAVHEAYVRYLSDFEVRLAGEREMDGPRTCFSGVTYGLPRRWHASPSLVRHGFDVSARVMCHPVAGCSVLLLDRYLVRCS